MHWSTLYRQTGPGDVDDGGTGSDTRGGTGVDYITVRTLADARPLLANSAREKIDGPFI